MPMTKIFTENDLVRSLYGELTQEETAEFQQALIARPSLREELNELQEVTKGLDKVRYQPSLKTLKKIMDFSKGYEVHSA